VVRLQNREKGRQLRVGPCKPRRRRKGSTAQGNRREDGIAGSKFWDGEDWTAQSCDDQRRGCKVPHTRPHEPLVEACGVLRAEKVEGVRRFGGKSESCRQRWFQASNIQCSALRANRQKIRETNFPWLPGSKPVRAWWENRSN